MVTTTHDEIVRRAVNDSTRSRTREGVTHSSLQWSTVPSAAKESLCTADDEDAAKLSSSISGDAPLWSSKARFPEGPW
jgi:hypothetical protein